MRLNTMKSKLALGITAALVTGTVGVMTLGAVHAVSPGQMPTNKEMCKHDGWRAFRNPDGSQMFKNQGDCVSHVVAHGGSGYGGGNTINTNVNVVLDHSNNNVINVIIKFVFGG